MKAILVDDEQWGLKRFEIECTSVQNIEIVGKFRNGHDALSYAQDNRVDLAFLDIEMPGMNGLELYDHLKELYPDIVAIFVSAYEKYWPEAMGKREADYFITKPYTESQVISAIERAKLLSARQRKRVQISTFGNFEVYVDGEALQFTSQLAKEILALLVDRCGDSVSYETLYREIWPDQKYSSEGASKFRHAMQRLQKTLQNAEIENILAYYPQARAIKCDMVEVDLYAMLREEPEAIRKYRGRYMAQYSWAEERVYSLNEIKIRHDPYAEETLYGGE